MAAFQAPHVDMSAGQMVAASTQAGVTVLGRVAFEQAKSSPVKTTAACLTIPIRHEAHANRLRTST